ncbi:MAG: hypothetical protein JJW00_05675 [Sulfurimonas sp.]|nr:hypothetical protein [Sulfurimonas sp.]
MRVKHQIEKVLIKSGKFSLPSKRVLYEADNSVEFISIDATQSQIQRPEKAKKIVKIINLPIAIKKRTK